MTATPSSARALLLYRFCRMQLPAIPLPPERFTAHLERTHRLFAGKSPEPIAWESYVSSLYALDWYVSSACLENIPKAWEALFALRTGRNDCLLIDALRARAVRLYPRDEERRENAVAEFWSHLLVVERAESTAILARYDGQRPLAPWLIRVFQNWHVSRLRTNTGTIALPEDDMAMPLPERPAAEERWHEVFRDSARAWLLTLDEEALLLLGLLWRYQLTQRIVAERFGKHEGTISRRIEELRLKCLEHVRKDMAIAGWSGDDLQAFILTEMHALLTDEPKLGVDHLRGIMARKGWTPV